GEVIDTHTADGLKVAREHDLIVDQLGELERVLVRSGPAAALPLMSQALPGFAEAMRQHFFFEERIFYPALATTIPTAGIIERILLLQKEHGLMEERLRLLTQLIQAPCPSAEAFVALVHHELLDLVNLVKRHAVVEITDIFPRINQNPLCLKMVLDLAQRETNKAEKKATPEA
ncbi:MAG TPA: hemerythrin domain-containing protein, partial [Candidatus Ozemobacteraceae bacterium]|nr:hemerythrin domain-containing protein [Candidatus Ozemobacteraceae bacterium]